ncbi:MAG: hypothetical protein MUQ64_04550 [Paracoccaceae bacterium]|jgi:hypothetical protein|nr:hypothetical protein [Paracoccaceae bacterium]
MKKICPEWLFAVVSALVAQRFLSASLGLNVFALKYSTIMNEHFQPIAPDLIESAAEGYLRFLLEVEGEDAHTMLQSYIFNKLTVDESGAPRKLKTMFGSQLAGVKDVEFGVEQAVKSFTRFVYAARSKPELRAAASWTWNSIENAEWLLTLPTVEVSILDGV